MAAALAAAFCLVPLPISRVFDTGLVAPDPAFAEPVGLVDPGKLTEVTAREGQRVRKGEVLARFEGSELKEQRAEAESNRDEQRIVADRLREDASILRFQQPEQQGLLLREQQGAADRAAMYQSTINLLTERLQGLRELRSPQDGIVMGLPKSNEVGKMFDKNYTQGQPICTVADPTRLIVKMPVSPVDYRLLKEDLPRTGSLDASVYVSGRTDHVFRGKVVRLPESDAKQVPVALTQRGGGPLAVKQSGEGGQEVSARWLRPTSSRSN